MKLNLGCGNDIKEGYINHDLRKHRKEVDLEFDLNIDDWTELWIKEPPNIKRLVEPNSFDEIRVWDVLEHLDDCINFMNNCWELLGEDGILDIKVCGYQNESFHIDPTHKKGYHVRSFDYFVPETPLGKSYGFYTDKKWNFIEHPHYDRKGNVIIKLTPIK